MIEALKRNIVITGIPRAGTTLLTALVDSMPDSVALNEPAWQYDWAERNRATSGAEDFARWLVGDFAALRQQLLNKIPVPERRKPDGSAVTNYYRPDGTERKIEETFEIVPFIRDGLTPDFTLAIKHNGPYLAALDAIVKTGAFTVLAIIRHPVGVIASWNEIPIPARQGKMPGAMLHWEKMRALTQSDMDLLEKQVRMYDLVCKRLHRLRDHIHIIKYEELTDNPAMLAAFTGKKPALPGTKIEKRQKGFYKADIAAIEKKILELGEYYKYFYTL